MKKIFSARRNALFSLVPWSWGGGLLLVAVFLLVLRLSVPTFFWTLTTPLFGVADTAAGSARTFFARFTATADLVVESDRLIEENTNLKNENRALKAQLQDAGAFTEREGVLARVVARPPQSPYDTLIVAQGSSGVQEGMEAFAPGSVPLGVVERVEGSFAFIVLFSAPGRTTEAWIGEENVPVTLLGAGGGTFRATLPRTNVVAEGDTVYVPGPGKYPIGTIVRIADDPSAPAVELYIAPLANPFALSAIELRDTGLTLRMSAPLFATSTLP